MSAPCIRILVIEDNPADVRLIRELFRQAGASRFDIRTADTLGAGLARLRAEGADLVLLDLSLPDSYGLDTFRQARQQAPGVPFILLTHLDDEDIALQTVQEGAQDYLVKGHVDSRLLGSAVRYAIERKKAQDEIAQYAAELARRSAVLQEELRMARELQLALLPQRYPNVPEDAPPGDSALRFHHVYLPTEEIGGDFFAVMPLGGNACGVFLCDVMGHGVQAALVTAIVRGLLEEHGASARRPGPFLGSINRSLARVLHATGSPMFVTAFYATVDVTDGRMDFASAGHPSPLVLRRSSGSVLALADGPGAGGPALGLHESAEYPVLRETAEEGDVMVLFTDGLYEVPDAEDEAFDVPRVREFLRAHMDRPPPELFGELLDAVRRHSATGAFLDDVCLVACEVARIGGPRG